MRTILVALLVSMPWCGGLDLHAADGFPPVRFQEISAGLAQPLSITHAGDGSGRLFIVERAGRIRIWNGSVLLTTPFLEITSLVGDASGEQGLLGLAFHPQYAINGYFYVNYTDNAGDTVIARYTRSVNPNVADPASAYQILAIDQPYANHNGGDLHFGLDGLLYIALGDGGDAGDPGNRAQNLNSLLGKVLRIDVDAPPGVPYEIPESNPFHGATDARGEIWAYGLRNPWRFSFDRQTGDMYIGDVGQGSREEIDFEPATSTGGANYGWRIMEGTLCYSPSTGCNSTGLTLPIVDYGRSLGTSVTGGYVYRGSRSPRLHGVYVFGDFGSGRVWGARYSTTGWDWTQIGTLGAGFALTSFGEDEAGELYATHYSGRLLRVVSIATPADFTGDGFSEMVLFRRGAWLGYAGARSQWTGPETADCIPAPGDFDGDGKTDYATWCSGAWHFFNPDGTYRKGIWTGATPGDIPVPADYDGDGDDDPAVYSGGAWVFFDFETSARVRAQWTGPGPNTVPLPMDYDGDGRAELTVYGSGAWHFFNDDGTYNRGIWTGATPGDIPVPGDYDGDGDEDPVVFSGGAWVFFDLANGARLRDIWTAAGEPAPLDYDGDGSIDMTVVAGGAWHSFNDNGSYRSGTWAAASSVDRPISRRQQPKP